MRKLGVYLFLAMLLVTLLLCGCISQNQYPAGKDTVEVFGNGEYQIIGADSNGTLTNTKYNVSVMRSVVCWDRVEQSVYFIGTDMYHPDYGVRIFGVLSLDSNIMELYWAEEVESAYLAELNRLPEDCKVIIHSSSYCFQEDDWRILQSIVKTGDG